MKTMTTELGGSIARIAAMGGMFRPRICFAPEDGGGSGGGGEAGAAETPPAAGGGDQKPPEMVLFPSEKRPEGGEGGEQKANDPAGDGKTEADAWKPYEDDPAKSKEENDKARAENEAKNPDNPLNKVPEDGKYDLKMPEGIEVDATLLGALAPEFKEMGLTQAQAQKLADRFIEVKKAQAEASAKEFATTVAKWADDAKADKEIGGTKWDRSVELAQNAMKKFGTPELFEYMSVTGGGNHPELIRFAARVGAAISEDRPPNGDSGGKSAPVEAAHVLFPNDVPKR